MFSVLVIRLRSLRLLRVSGIVMRLRMFLLLITFLKASHSFRNRLLVDRKSGSAGMPRPISYAVFCLKKKNIVTAGAQISIHDYRMNAASPAHLSLRIAYKSLKI